MKQFVKVLGQEMVHRFTANRAMKRATVSAETPAAALGRKFYRNETPLTIGIGESKDYHSTTGSKKVITKLSNLAVSNNYKKFLGLKSPCCTLCCRDVSKSGFISRQLIIQNIAFFTIDNFDLVQDTKDGKDQ